MGVMIWVGSHLLPDGDGRSVVLFGALALWSILAMLFTNRRDGARIKPEPV